MPREHTCGVYLIEVGDSVDSANKKERRLLRAARRGKTSTVATLLTRHINAININVTNKVFLVLAYTLASALFEATSGLVG